MKRSMKIAAPDLSAVSKKTVSRKLFHGIAPLCAAVFLSSCGGGGSISGGGNNSGGGNGSNSGAISFSASPISFKAAGPFAQAPATQTVTGTVTGLTSSGTLYITVVANNPNSFFTVTNATISGNSGQVGVIPAVPVGLQPGSYKGSITVKACLNDPTCATGQLSGSPQTIQVSYENGTGVDGDTVTPRVVPANATGTVILRGGGFTGATSVSFGGVAATSMTIASNTEIHASYPALAAGTYPVTINAGGIAYTASLVAVSPPAFTQTLLAYPAGVGAQGPLGIEYDAQRTALLIALPGTTSTNNELNYTLLRYAFDRNTNTWGSPTQITLQGLGQIHLSPDGSHLLALTQSGVQTIMVELDPVTLAQTDATILYFTYNVAGFALANDGNALVVLSSGAQFGDSFAFGTFSRVFSPMSGTGIGLPVASGNGAIVELGSAEFVASNEMIATSGAHTSGGSTADLAGDLFLNGSNVENPTGQILADVSTAFNAVNWAGTRAFGYTPNVSSCAPTLSTFDLTATPSGGQYPIIGAPISLPHSCDNGPDLLAVTPDGSTVFIAGSTGVYVQPVTP